MNTIRIRTRGAFNLALDDLHDFQGDLKTVTVERFEKLKASILKTGFSFVPHCWQNPDDKKWMIVVGHTRCNVLRRLQREGYLIPPIPVNPVEADNFKEAREKILQSSSQYGEMTTESLFEFAHNSQIPVEDIADLYELTDIDADKYIEEFTEAEPAPQTEEPKPICEACGQKLK